MKQKKVKAMSNKADRYELWFKPESDVVLIVDKVYSTIWYRWMPENKWDINTSQEEIKAYLKQIDNESKKINKTLGLN